MKKICIESENIGKCTIESQKEIPIANEFAIKALISIQVLLLKSDARTDSDTKEIVSILEESAIKVSQIFKDKYNEQSPNYKF